MEFDSGNIIKKANEKLAKCIELMGVLSRDNIPIFLILSKNNTRRVSYERTKFIKKGICIVSIRRV